MNTPHKNGWAVAILGCMLLLIMLSTADRLADTLIAFAEDSAGAVAAEGAVAAAAETQKPTPTITASYRHDGPAVLNDLKATPGKVRTTSLSAVCTQKTPQFRNTTEKMKNQVYAAYGVERDKGVCKGGCEVDHLISLEIGGADDITNLWPQPSQPKPGFHEKDKLENWLHAQVCSKAMSLTDAQTGIAKDWYTLYKKMPKAKQ